MKIGVFHPLIFVALGIQAWLNKNGYICAWAVTEKLSDTLQEASVDVLIVGHVRWPLMLEELDRAVAANSLKLLRTGVLALAQTALRAEMAHLLRGVGVRVIVPFPDNSENAEGNFRDMIAIAHKCGAFFYDGRYVPVTWDHWPKEPQSLTPREYQIASLLVEGLSAKEVGDSLELSWRTVETHRSNFMRKLGVHNIVQLIAYMSMGSVPINASESQVEALAQGA